MCLLKNAFCLYFSTKQSRLLLSSEMLQFFSEIDSQSKLSFVVIVISEYLMDVKKVL